MSPSLCLFYYLFTLQELLLFSLFRRYPFYLSSWLQFCYLHLLLTFLQIYIGYTLFYFYRLLDLLVVIESVQSPRCRSSFRVNSNQTFTWSHTFLNTHLSVSREKKYTLKFLFPTFRSSSSAAIWAAESLLRCGGRELEELLLIRSHTLFISSLICQFVLLTKEMKEKYLKKA